MTGVRILLFDELTLTPGWSQWDAAMARRLPDAHSDRTLVLAGNPHTPTSVIDSGTPMGAHLAAERPAVRSIRIAYGTLGASTTLGHGDPGATRETRGYAAPRTAS
ncbi:hypothetical protein ABZ897_42855 [Nonomuraea sp. NPDC046802]|uniref:hypothetical protein n=1 Tax=Nonomuraea sp. NPDC046802 TaxID=3154919 RepID=UPI0033EDC2AC